MPRLYLRFYLAVLGCLVAFAVGAALLWHTYGPPMQLSGWSHGFVVVALFLLAAGLALAAFPFVRSLTRRLERLQQGAESLAGGELSARVAVEGRDEIASLATSFNRAAARIEQLMGAHRLLLAQASHELRTPVTRLRLALELIDGINPERRRGMESDIAELDDLIEEILLASRLDTRTELEHREAVDLPALVAEECARYGVADLDTDPIQVEGDPRLLRRLVRNLLDNALRHGQRPVRVRVRAHTREAELAVVDAGSGIPEGEEREHLFVPFHRQGNTQGHGLGLSLVRQIARRHGGEATYEDMAGFGVGFRVQMPALGVDAYIKPTTVDH